MLEIIKYINNDFKAFNIEDSVESLQYFFAEYTFTHFPILKDGVYIGCIPTEDLINFESKKQLKDYINFLEGFYVRNNMMWLDVLEVFTQNNTNIIPVLDQNNKYLGYYELNDVIRGFYETPFLRENGGILVIEKPVNDYSMSQIGQIIESNNGRVLGMFVSNLTLETVQVTVKITLGSLNEIIQTFRRYNYEIISEHQEDEYLENLKERSDYLNKYLNI